MGRARSRSGLRSRRVLRALAVAVMLVGWLVACGSRTGLFVDGAPGLLPPDDDGGETDGRVPRADGSRDAELDGLPIIDARPPRDVDRTDCPDADTTVIYVVTTDYELYSFNPADAAFRRIGRIACPAPTGSTPFSMAVDRKGVAYVVFNDGNLYRVSTATAACVSTPFATGQLGYQVFGMAFATDIAGPTETLFIAGDERANATRGLARIGIPSFIINRIGPFVPVIDRAELTGTGDGRLFAFYSKGIDPVGSFIGEIDQGDARVIAETPLPSVDQGNGWAFAFWGGDFYMFHAPDQPSSRVTRYRPSDGSVVQVATLPTIIVGAGVSTCAPTQ